MASACACADDVPSPRTKAGGQNSSASEEVEDDKFAVMLFAQKIEERPVMGLTTQCMSAHLNLG